MSAVKRPWLTYVVFGIYAALLVWLIVFKFATSLDEIPSMRNLNLIPLTDLTVTNNEVVIDEMVYNLAVFIPFGIYMRILLAHRHWIFQVLPSLMTSLLFEMVQYAFAIGGSDITDVITNTAGGLVGVGSCALLMKWRPEDYEKIFNRIGIVLEAILLTLLTALLIANS